MTNAKISLSVAELALEVARERIDPDAFDGLGVSRQSVEFAAALRVAEVLPISGFVSCAGEARLFDEGFEQHRAIGVAGLPIIGQSAADQGEDARGEVFAADPRQDEEAGVVDDQVQVAPTLIARPTDDLIPGFNLPGARAEAKGGYDVAGGAHEVAQLRAGHQLMPEVMMALDIRVPQQRVGFAENRLELQRGKVDVRDAARLQDRL